MKNPKLRPGWELVVPSDASRKRPHYSYSVSGYCAQVEEVEYDDDDPDTEFEWRTYRPIVIGKEEEEFVCEMTDWGDDGMYPDREGTTKDLSKAMVSAEKSLKTLIDKDVQDLQRAVRTIGRGSK